MPRARMLGAPLAAELLILISLLCAFGFAIAPAHTSTLWADGFTGWVVPVANRLAAGSRLYENGFHIPLPPGSFVLSFALFGGDGTWLSESVLCSILQALTLLLLYGALSAVLPRPIPFLACFASLPLFLSLHKSILYDALVQFWVAVVSIVAMAAASRGWLDLRPRATLLLLGATTAFAVLSKQNTGLGLLAGVSLLLIVAPRRATVPRRFLHAVGYIVGTAFCAALLALAAQPWASPAGLLQDVFLTGSEPKGGSIAILTRLLGILSILALDLGFMGFLAFMVYGALESRGPLRLPRDWFRLSDLGEPARNILYVAAISTAALVVIAGLSIGPTLVRSRPILRLSEQALFLALGLSIAAAVLTLTRKSGEGDTARNRVDPLAGLLVVLLPAALFHSLSVSLFRWTHDNNPLIVVALANLLVFGLLSATRLTTTGRIRMLCLVGVVITIQSLSWVRLGTRLLEVREANDRWPEIAHLSGARMPLGAEGMRSLVETVRRESRPFDYVALLPNDPDVEAWFERPRFPFSSAIVFADQYWDRYVDDDFERMLEYPPKVIIIGPEGYWHFFSNSWNADWGTTRLVFRVLTELIPAYEALEKQPIEYLGRKGHMQVFLRKDRERLEADLHDAHQRGNIREVERLIKVIRLLKASR